MFHIHNLKFIEVHCEGQGKNWRSEELLSPNLSQNSTERLREATTVIYLSQLQLILNVKVLSIRLEAIFF